jgi:hypothetical protein
MAEPPVSAITGGVEKATFGSQEKLISHILPLRIVIILPRTIQRPLIHDTFQQTDIFNCPFDLQPYTKEVLDLKEQFFFVFWEKYVQKRGNLIFSLN